MAFDVSTITAKGAELLAAATASDRFVIDGCDADTTVLTLPQAIQVEGRPASPVSNTTEVTPISHYVSNAIYIRAYFKAGVTTGGNANTLYVYGHLESDSTHTYVIYIACSSTSFHLPETGDVMDEWEARISISYNPSQDSIAYASIAAYATQAAVDSLEERMVSTTSFNNPTEGDNQDIYGIKGFLNGIETRYLSLPDDCYLCFGTTGDYTKLYGDDTYFNIVYDGGTGHKTIFNVSSDGVSGNIRTELGSHGNDLIFKVGKPQGTSYKDFHLSLKRSDSSSLHNLVVEPSAEGSSIDGYEVDLGSSAKPFKNVFAYSYNGRFPYQGESDPLPPIGGMFLAILEGIGGTGNSPKNPGYCIDLSDPTAYNGREYNIYGALSLPMSSNVPSFTKGTDFTTAGTQYIILCGISFGSGEHDSDFLALVQRIL